MNNLDDTFSKLLGRQASDSERQQLYRIRDALEIKNNDALWLVLMALQHYQSMYEAFPPLIESAARDALANFKHVADATAKAAAQTTKADLASAVAAAARDVARFTAGRSMARWIAGCALSTCLVLMVFGWYVDSRARASGHESGYAAAYEQAKDEKAAAAWANTPEGRKAWQLARAGDIGRLIDCDQPGWFTKNGGCYVDRAPDKMLYGWRIRK
jgi:hypothetical protein